MKKKPHDREYCSHEKVEEMDPNYLLLYFLGAATLIFSLNATVRPKIRNCQNFENVGFTI